MHLGHTLGDWVMRLPGLGNPVRRLRAHLRRRSTPPTTSVATYRQWVCRHDTPSREMLRERQAEAKDFRRQPVISLLMPVAGPRRALVDEAIRSVKAQSYPHWELCVGVAACSPPVRALLERHARLDDRIRIVASRPSGGRAAAANAALDLATGDYVAILDPEDALPPLALHWIAEAIDRHPDAGLIYSDEDCIDDRGRRSNPYFKCDFDAVAALTHDLISRLAVCRRDVAVGLGGVRPEFGEAGAYDLALRCVAAVGRDRVVHVPRILYHRRTAGRGSWLAHEAPVAAEAVRRAAADHLKQVDPAATIAPAPDFPAASRIRHALPEPPPLVSIVICTRDHEHLVRTAVGSIRERTSYPRYEIVVLDNGSRDAGTLACLRELAALPGVTVVRDDSPFNYSRLNNTAVRHGRGEVICLLNDDIEVVSPGWLEEMVSFAVRPEVGAVGAKLWYPDGTLQHGGVIVGMGGVAGHAHYRLAAGRRGGYCRAVLQQELSVVTAACLAVRRTVFDEMGGLDEGLAVAFNDVDFCLRLRAAGYRNVWTPFAELIHHESASRGYEDTPEKQARFRGEIRFMQERWGATLHADPYYNPNLSLATGDYTLALPAPPPSQRTAA